MDKNKQSEIARLKEKLLQNEVAYQDHHRLLDKREELNRLIQNRQDDLEKTLIQLHQNPRLEYEEAKTYDKLNNKINKDKALLEELKQKRRELDHRLDKTEELTSESLDHLRLELTEFILQQHPEQREERQQRNQQLEEQKQLERNLERLHEALKKLHSIITAIHETRRSINGRGILNYIFGISPNMIIERHLNECARLIEATLQLLTRFKDENPHSAMIPLYEKLQAFLLKIQPHFKGIWGFRQIDTTFVEIQAELALHLNEFHQALINVKNKKNELEIEKEIWFQQF